MAHRKSYIRKTRLASVPKVRAILRKLGYEIAHWADNGRISGMANIFGDVEVKEAWLDEKYEVGKFSDIRHQTVGVEISLWNHGKEKHNFSQILADLGNGYENITKSYEADDKLVIVEKS